MKYLIDNYSIINHHLAFIEVKINLGIEVATLAIEILGLNLNLIIQHKEFSKAPYIKAIH